MKEGGEKVVYRMHILVIHADPRFLKPLAVALQSAGHKVTARDNAMAAWDDLNRISINLLVTQVHFPYPQPDGVDLAAKARSVVPDVNAVFLGTAPFSFHANRMDTCLASPISVAQVMDAVANTSAPNSFSSKGSSRTPKQRSICIARPNPAIEHSDYRNNELRRC